MTKRYRKLLPLLLALSLLAGCAAKNQPPQPLPIGAIDQTDATTYRVLADAQAFLTSIRGSVTEGKLTLNPTQKQVFNSLVASYNATEVLWKAYHSGQSKDAQGLATATAKLNTDLTAATAQITVGGK